jgi:hypothetical protein
VVVVVTNACGSSAIRRTRCERRAGSSSEKTSSRSRSGGLASCAVTRSSSASFRRGSRPLLAARRERGQVPPGHHEREVVPVRPDQRRAVPDLLLGRLGEPALERVAGASPWNSGAFVTYSMPSAPAAASSGRDLGVRGRERAASRRAGRAAPRPRRRRRRGTAGPSSGARRARRSPRGSRAGGRCAAGARGP